MRKVIGLLAAGTALASSAAGAAPLDVATAARLFGARPEATRASLSPDGSKIALIVPGEGQATALVIVDAAEGATPHRVMGSSGKPDIIEACRWVANTRLACTIGGLTTLEGSILGFSAVVGVDADGKNVKLLSRRPGEGALSIRTYGGGVIDALPGEDGAVLMTRSYVPTAKIGSLIESKGNGLGVDRIDTRTGAARTVEPPKSLATEYITDGRGTVRIMGMRQVDGYDMNKPGIRYLYRLQGSSDWLPLSIHDGQKRTGFNPYVVDPDKNVAYGFDDVNGRQALVSVTLDNKLQRDVVLANAKVDVDHLLTVGRNQRFVGGGYTTDKTTLVYADPALERLIGSLQKALGGRELFVVDASTDERRLLLTTGSVTDPGEYFLFDRGTSKMMPIIASRPNLVGVTMSETTPVTYRATDGTAIPAYLTLPAGGAKAGLPAIVMPHGGPSARDVDEFDWLVQFFAARGYAVLQPQYRGSAGYGRAFQMDNAFKGWRTSIGDVTDAGRYLVSSGIADPRRLGIFGWSFGGYAALHAAALTPDLFKAVVAVAPVTDPATLFNNDGTLYFSNRELTKEFVGTAAQSAASPLRNADRLTMPTLVVHGLMDANVPVSQSKRLASRMGGKAEGLHAFMFVPDLEHQLDSSPVRTEMLTRADALFGQMGK